MDMEDMDQQHQVEFPDLAAIEKVERKGESLKKSPTHILNSFKKVEDRSISEKDRKKVEQRPKRAGLIQPSWRRHSAWRRTIILSF